MSDKPEAAAEAKPAKSKKMLVIILAAVLVLALAAGGAFFFLKKKNAASEDGEEAEPAKTAAKDSHSAPPALLPMDNMVVNLKDPGGERVAQIGVTFKVSDVKAVDTVKPYLPIIRSGVLMTISRYTADELLSEEGKTRLTRAIFVEAIKPFGGSEEDLPEEGEEDHSTPKKKKKRAAPQYPITGVLYSSFIVQ